MKCVWTYLFDDEERKMATFVGKTANSSHPTAGRGPHPMEGPTIALRQSASGAPRVRFAP